MYARFVSTEGPHLTVSVYGRYADNERQPWFAERLAVANGRGLVLLLAPGSGGWCSFYPDDGDAETQQMIELASSGRLPLSILADKIDEAEPVGDPAHPAFHLTRDLRRPDLVLAVLVC